SLFIANLSFGDNPAFSGLLDHAKLGIVVGSLLAGIAGFAILHLTLPKGVAPDPVEEE
ncbi:MAG: Na+/H+ antiporter NhaA, partial [Muribaculaceae bacterium]|nr:Na+/H+ antiporter NhaA [Muribaculaceae bacterium]